MLKWLRPGQKVVCITEVPPCDPSRGEIVPIENEVYTIRDVVDLYGNHLLGIRLEEIRNTENQYHECFGELAFHTDFFKPVFKNDISIFYEILKKASNKELA